MKHQENKIMKISGNQTVRLYFVSSRVLASEIRYRFRFQIILCGYSNNRKWSQNVNSHSFYTIGRYQDEKFICKQFTLHLNEYQLLLAFDLYISCYFTELVRTLSKLNFRCISGSGCIDQRTKVIIVVIPNVYKQ